jgi:aspartate carbamoyltransferase catalytic subunit
VPWAGRDFIDLDDYGLDEIEVLLDLAEEMLRSLSEPQRLPGNFQPLDRLLATCFFEPSTRTRLSFEAAMLRLGGGVLGMQDPKVSSSAKGESLEDTIRVIGGYCDAIVIRHPEAGAAARAAAATEVPVINAGDGARHHPTQTLTDLFALRRFAGGLSGLKVGLCGDLKYGRTVHSLAPTLARLDNELVCVSPPELALPEEILAEVEERSGSRPVEMTELAEALADLDVLYMTRIQAERFPDAAAYEQVRGVYVLDRDLLARAPEKMIILHPLPRVDEIATEVDADPRAQYFAQSAGGVPVRMALLALLLGLVGERGEARLGLAEPRAEAPR